MWAQCASMNDLSTGCDAPAMSRGRSSAGRASRFAATVPRPEGRSERVVVTGSMPPKAHRDQGRSLARIDPTELPQAALVEARSSRRRTRCDRAGGSPLRSLLPLFERATQTVFGEGPPKARLFLVGEQPGDPEDRAGSPFIGPAGRVLNRALAEAGIDRASVFLHQRRQALQVADGQPHRANVACTSVPRAPRSAPACRGSRPSWPWCARPAVVVLGATAAEALLGAGVRVTRDHGKPLPSTIAPVVVATIHPSAVLRAVDARDARENAFDGLVADLVVARDLAGRGSRRRARADVA